MTKFGCHYSEGVPLARSRSCHESGYFVAGEVIPAYKEIPKDGSSGGTGVRSPRRFAPRDDSLLFVFAPKECLWHETGMLKPACCRQVIPAYIDEPREGVMLNKGMRLPHFRRMPEIRNDRLHNCPCEAWMLKQTPGIRILPGMDNNVNKGVGSPRYTLLPVAGRK
jgi:hypothetical protein